LACNTGETTQLSTVTFSLIDEVGGVGKCSRRGFFALRAIANAKIDGVKNKWTMQIRGQFDNRTLVQGKKK